MERRNFLSLPMVAMQARSPYVSWSWERWREITGENRPALRTEQTRQAALADLLQFQSGKAVARDDWPQRRASIEQPVLAILGAPPENKPPLAPRILEEVKLPTHTRRKLVYQAEPGEFVPAYLLAPHKLEGRKPAVVCPHQTVQYGKDEPAGLAGIRGCIWPWSS